MKRFSKIFTHQAAATKSYALLIVALFSLSQMALGQTMETERLLDSIAARLPRWQEKYQAHRSRTLQINRAILEEVPFDIWSVSGLLIPAKKDTALAFCEIVLSDREYRGPFDFQEKILARQQWGEIALPNWHYLYHYQINLWQDYLYFDQPYDRGIPSPFNPAYRESYVFSEIKDHPDHPEQIILFFAPRAPGESLFEGYVHLDRQSLLPLKTDFYLAEPVNPAIADSIQIRQYYRVSENEYRLDSMELTLHAQWLGFNAQYQQKIKHRTFQFLSPEALESHHVVLEQNSKAFFGPRAKEMASLAYREFDSTELQNLTHLNMAPPYWRFHRGSRLNNHGLNFYNWSYRGHIYRRNKFFIGQLPLYKGLGFNPVEGAYLRYSFPIGLTFENSEWGLIPEFRYGLADQRLKTSASLYYEFDTASPKLLRLSGGTRYAQFDPNDPIEPVNNAISTLLLGENLIRLYGKDFLRTDYFFSNARGLFGSVGLEYAYRFPLFNQSSFSFFTDEPNYEPNNVIRPPVIDEDGFEPHRGLTFDLDFNYQFGAIYSSRYSLRYDRKVNPLERLRIDRPRIYYKLRIGIPTGFSVTNYLQQRLGISQLIGFGNWGRSLADISVGHFAYRDEVPFIDWTHFDGLQFFLLQPAATPLATIRQFNTLPYYEFSTIDPFLEYHYEHSFQGRLLQNIDLLRRWSWQSSAGVNGLWVAGQGAYQEYYLGLGNLLRVLKVEYAVGTDFMGNWQYNLRLGLNFNHQFYVRNRPDKPND